MVSQTLSASLGPRDPVSMAFAVIRGAAVNIPAPRAITETTTPTNGLTTATVGIRVGAGSCTETDKTNDAAHFLEHMAFKGTGCRSRCALELEVENLGVHFNAYTSREQTVYYTKSFRKDLTNVVGIVSDILPNSRFESTAVERGWDQLEEVVFGHLGLVAFQANILSTKREDLSNYIKTNYSPHRMILVGRGAGGGVYHHELAQLAEKHFSSLPVSPIGRLAHPRLGFIGSEVRIQDDELPCAQLAIAFEGVGWSSPDYPLCSWDRSWGTSPLLSSRLSRIVSSNALANSFMCFSTSYSDNLVNLDDVTHFTLKGWTRMSNAPTDVEVEQAKSQLKASLLSLDGITVIAEDTGRQLITAGRRSTPKQIESAIDAVTPEEIKPVSRK
ncbi:hypothetical protein BDN67DRAFT_988607 [Paxillus ammoniavirescens]|nr:hypothetical protein BDN67DRAFT_988607 [Paxillus ammoniavirescens]